MTYRCALITGASSGIGEAFARALPKSTTLLLNGLDRARLIAKAFGLAGSKLIIVGGRVDELDREMRGFASSRLGRPFFGFTRVLALLGCALPQFV